MSFNWKTASADERKGECKRLAAEIGDDQFFTKKELNHLPEVLGDGEQVLSFVSGLYQNSTWLVALTDTRLLFLNKGMVFGLKQTTLDLSKVYSVTAKTGIVFGKITVDAGSEHVIDNVLKKTVVPFTNKVQTQMTALKQGSAVTTFAPVAPASIVDQLERLASLRDKGILSDEEFSAQKAKLLASA